MQRVQRRCNREVKRYLRRLSDKGVVEAKRYNGRYEAIQVMSILFMAALWRTFIESAVTRLLYRRLDGVPSGDTVIRRLKRQGTAAVNGLISFNDELVREGRRRRWFKKPVTVAVDEWGREYYGRSRDIHCSTGKEKNGTRYFHTVMTLAVIEHGKRLELAMLPMSLLSSREMALRQLIVHAQKHIKIRVVLLDRGFNSIGVIRVLDSLGVRYIMPMTRNARVKKEIKDTVGLQFRVIRDYQFRLRSYQRATLVIWCAVSDGPARSDAYLVYVTNIPVGSDRFSATAICDFYRARWGIETGYRVKKWEFRAKTCSESAIVRFVLILLAIILFNIWTLVRYEKNYCGRNGVPAYIFAEDFAQSITAQAS